MTDPAKQPTKKKAYLTNGLAGGTLVEEGAGDEYIVVNVAVRGRVHACRYKNVGPGIHGEINYEIESVIEDAETDHAAEVPYTDPASVPREDVDL